MPEVILLESDYTVAWICALSIEFSAALDMLDEKHEHVYMEHESTNVYHFGRCGKHNVVVTALPEGVYGNSIAASVATEVWRTFTNIKFMLLVGIAGGIPWAGTHDVRLGDVVIGVQPSDSTNPAVIQYDYGRTVAEGRFIRTGILDNPPKKLLSAITVMKGTTKWRPKRLEDRVYDTIKTTMKQNEAFKDPGKKRDILFQATCVHEAVSNPLASRCNHCPKAKRVARPRRTVGLSPLSTSDDTHPTIHYGNIASGNQLVRDADKRDGIGIATKALCIEMQAAGVSTSKDRSCLVIRGICDYADTHKNDEWQSFAALAAAAVAKEVLLSLEPGLRAPRESDSGSSRSRSGERQNPSPEQHTPAQQGYGFSTMGPLLGLTNGLMAGSALPNNPWNMAFYDISGQMISNSQNPNNLANRFGANAPQYPQYFPNYHLDYHPNYRHNYRPNDSNGAPRSGQQSPRRFVSYSDLEFNDSRRSS